MAKTIKINGVTYSDVPSVQVPLADNSGNASFVDLPSLSNPAAAAQILSGYEAINGSGAKLTGTYSGGSAPVKKAVNFYDPFGKLVAGYTVAEAQALSALPTAPDYSAYVEPFTGATIPLTFQSWNYTLAQVKATTVPINVGATYKPTDGKTHFILRVTATTGYAVPIYYYKNGTNTLTIDWGDGSAQTTDSSSGNRSQTHTFTAGTYHCTMWVTSGSSYEFGDGTNSFVGGTTAAYRACLLTCYAGDYLDYMNGSAFNGCSCLTFITLSSAITTMRGTMFTECSSLVAITIPSGITSILGDTFTYCLSLTTVALPSGITSISTYVFLGCYALTSITIPSGVTSIASALFYNCFSLTSITLASTVTSIASNAFYNCHSIKHFYIYPTTVPTLSATDAFTGIKASCIIHVPAASATAYKAATNWSTYANYIIGDAA